MKRSGDSGQASVELVAVIPLIVLLVVGVWQAAIAVRSVVLAEVDARNAARADAVGADPRSAAVRSIPSGFGSALSLRRERTGAIRARVAVPVVMGAGASVHVEAAAAFPGQGR